MKLIINNLIIKKELIIIIHIYKKYNLFIEISVSTPTDISNPSNVDILLV
jgi:hypothetical protein